MRKTLGISVLTYLGMSLFLIAALPLYALSPGSNGNEIKGNKFENIAALEVFIEGQGNRVEYIKTTDSIRDLGIKNIIIQSAVVADTTRYTIIVDGHRKAERLQWKEASDIWGYEYRGNSYDSYHFPRTERLVLDRDGSPLQMVINAQRTFWDQWIEHYERSNGQAEWTAHTESSLGPEWSRTLDEGESKITGPVYYAAVHPVHDLGVPARLLLKQSDNKLPLLPDGKAHLEFIKEKVVETDKDQRKLRLYAIHGLDFRPQYVWLDNKNATFADEWSVLSGWEEVFPELRAIIEEALATYHYELVKDLIPTARKKPLVIHGAKLFDPETQTVHSGTTVLIEGNTISAVGPDGTLKTPPEAEIIDAAGKMILPGLWDMHTHHGISETYLELMAPLYMAAGITTARDLGSPTVPTLSLRRRIEAGEALGPRLLLAGWVEGGSGRPTGPLVNNAAEALVAVDRFAELGYVQIKIYGTLSPDLVPVVIERAKKHGLRVSGHIPKGMTWQQAIEMGYDEIQHIGHFIDPLLSKKLADLSSKPTPALLEEYHKAKAEIATDSEEVQEMIRLLASKNIAVDPTLAFLDAQGMEPQGWVKRIAERFPSTARRQIFDLYLFGYWPLNPLRQQTFDNWSDIVREMHEEGIAILPGSDMEIAGFSLHRELEIYTEAGIPAPEVLSLATLGAAREMGMDNELGSIGRGKLADLILVDGDPTKDISDIRRVIMVIKDGRVYDSAAIYKALGIEPCCEE